MKDLWTVHLHQHEETDPFKDTSYFRPVIIHILQLLFPFQSYDWGVGAKYELEKWMQRDGRRIRIAINWR